MVSFAVSLPRWAAATESQKTMSCPGIGANWSGTDSLSAHCKVVPTVPRTAAGGPLQNARALRGNVALVDRGGASYTDKAVALAEAGAIGIIFINDDDALVAPRGAVDAAHTLSLVIPAVCIAKSAGQRLRSMLQLLDDIAKSRPATRPAVGGRGSTHHSQRWGTASAVESSVDVSWSVLPPDEQKADAEDEAARTLAAAETEARPEAEEEENCKMAAEQRVSEKDAKASAAAEGASTLESNEKHDADVAAASADTKREFQARAATRASAKAAAANAAVAASLVSNCTLYC
jgi:hypothetical protein